jgi:hypothetical protein
MLRKIFRPLIAAFALVTSFAVVLAIHQSSASAGALSRGNLTMVSTLADGTTGPALPTTEGADQEAISEDGKVVAFTSKVAAQLIVTDPTQTNHVTDTNDADDVFVWDSRVPAPLGPVVSLVSQNASKTGTGNAASTFPTIAPEGIGVVFQSGATDLTSVPVGPHSDHIYAWVPLISSIAPVFMVDENYQNTAGSDSVSDDASIAVSLVPPMARVAFHSTGSDLVDPIAHPAQADQVYVRTYTLATPSTQLVSVGTDGKGTASGASEPMIAADAEHVVFTSGGDKLVSGIDGTGGDIFERNLLTSSTTLISKANSGSQGTSGNNSPVISANGGAIAWDGNDPNLSAIPHTPLAHVFYWSALTGVQMVDTDLTSAQGCNQFSNDPGISLDGTMVDYESACTDSTDPSITSSGYQVFARRMMLDPAVPALPDLHPQLISVNADGTGSGNADAFLCPGNNPPHCGASSNPGLTMSADGTAIAFFSSSGNLPGVVTPPQGVGNVFVRYPDGLGGGSTVDLTTTAAASNPDEDSRDPVMSADGGTVAFVSLADDLVTPDTNDATDVFTADLHNKFVFNPISAVNEGDGSVTISITRTGSNGTADSVEVTTGDGSTPDIPGLPAEISNPANSNATAPADYTAVDKTLLFPPGVPTETFTVPIVDDNVVEDPELFHVSLSSASGAGSTALPGPLSEAYVVILDNDADSTPPDVSIDEASGQGDPTSTSPIVFDATFSEPVTGFDSSDVSVAGSTAGGLLTATVTGSGADYQISVSGMTSSGDVTVSLPAGAAIDQASNPSTASTAADGTVAWVQTADVTPPDVSIDKAAGQGDPTSTSPIVFDATFSEPVSGFTSGDVTFAGSSAGGALTATITGGPSAYQISVSGMTAPGTVDVAIPAGAAIDAANNPSTASTAIDDSVAWVQPADTTDPDVVVDKASGQTDPTATAPIVFTATFSEPVSGFDGSDVGFAGSTAGGVLAASVSGGPSVYDVSVSGMTTSGDVTVSIAAGAAIDAASNPSTASTAIDGTVAWAQSVDTTPPDVTVDQAAGQSDPTSTSPIVYTATFSEPVSGFTAADVSIGGTAGGALAAIVTGGPTAYTVSVSGMTTTGTVTVSVPAGAAIDAASNPSTGSTSTDNSVTWQQADTTAPDVTVNKGAAQADPTSTSPIAFIATFSEPVTGFDTSDVSFAGSTAGGMLAATITGGPTAYAVSVSGMTTAGLVEVSLPAGAAIDGASNPSTASTSTDNTVGWTIANTTSSVALVLAPSPSVYGQAVTATATVSLASGTPSGTVQFAVDGTDVGAPAVVGAGGVADSPDLSPLAVGSHTVTAEFAPSDPSAVQGSTGSSGLVVNEATTITAVAVHPTTLSATVTAQAPGSGTPTGSVTFSVDGQTVGQAPLSGGQATLTYTTPVGMTRHVAAAYGGSANFMASSASTSRSDPTITAHVTSAHAKTKFGWYRSSVKITFTCTINGAPLTAPCPAAVSLTHNGAAQVVSRTIKATDGGIRTVTVKGVNIDETAPSVRLTGATKGQRYLRPGPTVHCGGSDSLSGLASCVLTRHTTKGVNNDTVAYKVVATDKAGNTRTVTGSYQTSRFVIAGAVFSNGAYTVHRGKTYTLLVSGTGSRPTYYDAAPYPTTPFKSDNEFHAAGHNRWSIAVLMQHNLKAHAYWNVGVKIGSKVYSVKIRAVA